MKLIKYISIAAHLVGLLFLPLYLISDIDLIGVISYFSLALGSLLYFFTSIRQIIRKRRRNTEGGSNDPDSQSE